MRSLVLVCYYQKMCFSFSQILFIASFYSFLSQPIFHHLYLVYSIQDSLTWIQILVLLILFHEPLPKKGSLPIWSSSSKSFFSSSSRQKLNTFTLQYIFIIAPVFYTIQEISILAWSDYLHFVARKRSYCYISTHINSQPKISHNFYLPQMNGYSSLQQMNWYTNPSTNGLNC